MAAVEQALQEALSQLGSNVPEKTKKKIEETIKKVYIEGKTPKEAIGMSDEMVEFVYAHAYRLFQSGSYAKAVSIFKWLRELDPGSYRYSYCIAAGYHRMKDYQRAIGAYALSTILEADNPEPYFYMSDCFNALNDREKTISSLEEAIFLAEDQVDKYGKILELSQLMLKKLEMESKLKESKGTDSL